MGSALNRAEIADVVGFDKDFQRLGRYLLLTTVLAFVAVPALAQAQVQPDRGNVVAQAGAVVAFDIPAQPLTGALTAFGVQAGYQVSVDQASLAGLRSPGVSGRLTSRDALARLLAGTGATFRFTDTRSVVIEKPVTTGTAPAGQKNEAGPVILAPVTVTATKTAHAVDDVPANVSVLDREYIESRSPSKVEDLLRGLPGVDMEGGPRRAGQDVNIRGFGGQQVVVTLDGARQNFDAGHKGRFFVDPDLLRSVEVLRGSNSALHGSGAIGGVIAMETKGASDFLQPGQTAGFRTKLGYSSVAREPQYSVGGFARLDDRIDLFANFTYRDSGTMKQGGGRELDYSAEDIANGLFKATIRPDENQKLSLSFIQFNGSGTQPTNSDTAPNATSNPVVERDTKMTTLAGNYTYENPDMPLFSPTVKVYRNELSVRENRIIPATLRVDESFLVTNGFDVYNTARFGTGDVDHAVTAGIDFFNDSQKGARTTATGTAERSTFPEAEGQVVGYYLQDELSLLPGLTLTPALRYDTYNRDSSTISDFEESALSPKLAANWRALPWLGLYASYGKAFRAPSMTEAFVAGTHFFGNNFISNPGLRPEKAKTAEGGVRLKFDDIATAGDQLRFNTTYFHTEAKDLIELIVTSTTSKYTNTADATIKGFETELQYDMRQAFFGLGASRIRGDNNVTGNPLDSIPADKVTATIGGKLEDYGLRFGWRSEFVADQNRVSGTDTTGGVEGAVLATSGYVVHGVFMSWLPVQDWLAGFRVDAGVENIFDTTYRRHMTSLYEEGRDYRIAVSYTKGF